MLNYIWLSMIVIGVGVAVWSDVHDLSANTYHNGRSVAVAIEYSDRPERAGSATSPVPCTLIVTPAEFNSAYGASLKDTIRQKAEYLPTIRQGEDPSVYLPSHTGVLHILVDDRTPDLWKRIYKAQNNPDFLLARVEWSLPIYNVTPRLPTMTFDPVKFVNLNSVTNDGIIKYAKSAVELAIGLIGIMALWLGIMKIAEQSGLVSKLARLLKPLTTRLFPDVPPDHPAMGAMIMNISANMLGLANAATPLGLKAMEELNKLNRKAGTATDAMCTFLVINTSNIQIIPATVIAIRAAAGSANPTDILGPVIVATVISMVVGVTTVKLLARLPLFKRQLGEGHP
jgi:spore maturation protein A